jgi:hypothetical protein
MTKDEALRLALEALEAHADIGIKADKAITAIKAALEAKDEPDKYAMDIECTKCGAKQSGVLTVHTTPPQRKPLTDEEAKKLLRIGPVYAPDGLITRTPLAYRKELLETALWAFRKGEAAHGIKGEA